MNLSINHGSNIDNLLSRLGDDWLNSCLPPQPYREPHRIAMWVQNCRNVADRTQLGSSDSYLQLSRLAYYAQLLIETGAPEVEPRINDLRSDNDERVRSALHEIQVAGELIRTGHSVNFIQETDERRPDMLVDGQIEIECKHKGGFSQKDKGRLELYRILGRNVRKAFRPSVAASGLVVEARFFEEPTRQIVDEIVKTVKSAFRSSNQDIFPACNSSYDSTITIVRGEQKVQDELKIPHDRDITTDYFILEGIAAHYPFPDDASLGLTRPIALGFSCDIRMDVVKSLKGSIKSAVGQFSGDKPAIISVDISETMGNADASQIPQLNEVINEVMRNNATVSRIELVSDYFEEIQGKLSLQRKVQGFENPNARHPAPRL